MVPRLVRAGLIFVITVMTAGVAMAEEDAVYSQNESMMYRVGYGPAKLADMGFEVGCDDDTEVTAKLEASSRGMAQRVHPFRVRLDTRTDIGGGGSNWSQTWIREKGFVRRYRSRFDDAPRVATEAVIRGEESRDIIALPSDGHDLLSWILDLRYEVATGGEQTDTIRYPLWDGWKLVWLEVIPGDIESMDSSEGTVDAQAFRLQRTQIHHAEGRNFEPREATEEVGTIWIETSPRAIPVAMAFRAPIGHVRIDIQNYERGSQCE